LYARWLFLAANFYEKAQKGIFVLGARSKVVRDTERAAAVILDALLPLFDCQELTHKGGVWLIG
jgi:hypothetical protein